MGFLTAPQLAQKLRDAGIPCSESTPREWARRFAISQKVGGHRLFDERVVDMLLDGRSLDDIAARLSAERLKLARTPRRRKPPSAGAARARR